MTCESSFLRTSICFSVSSVGRRQRQGERLRPSLEAEGSKQASIKHTRWIVDEASIHVQVDLVFFPVTIEGSQVWRWVESVLVTATQEGRPWNSQQQVSNNESRLSGKRVVERGSRWVGVR